MATIISEHLSKSDISVEAVSLEQGNVWTKIKDGEAVIYKSLEDFILAEYCAEKVARKYCPEEELLMHYDESTSWYDLPLTIIN